ncbi:uncharacterized protein PgNI_09142 [Pyricularia grisea]|uniref:Uncharacterized protein n=1 Tax=Pyricularia grisea TaxID=148305 RepID=A0A6P8ARB3_PYRGI|nr:uncharacterized protein PgNI_09142 [Pyricularia grisea]TLD04658.1 hypothetical protein PgNI_09142 [Pyricularia grisea]
MPPHEYELRSRTTPENLLNEATCKDHKPAEAPQMVAGPSTAKLPSPSPENDCNYEPKRVPHLTDKRAAYLCESAFKLLRPKLVPHDRPGSHEEVLIPVREGEGAPIVPMQRKLIRMGQQKAGLLSDDEEPEVLDEIVVGGTKVNQKNDSNFNQGNGSKTGKEDGINSEQAAVQGVEPVTDTYMSEVGKTMVAGTIADENHSVNDGDNDSHTEVDSQTSAAEVRSPFEDTTMADRPSAVLKSRVANKHVAEDDEATVAASMADQSGSSDDELTEVEPDAPVTKARIAYTKSHVEDVAMVDAQEMEIVVESTLLDQDTKGNLRAVAEDEEHNADTFTANESVAEAPIREATVAQAPIAEKNLEDTTAANRPMTKSYKIIGDSAAEPDTARNLYMMTVLGESTPNASLAETPVATTLRETPPVTEALMADGNMDTAASQAAAIVITPHSTVPAFPAVVNPAPGLSNPAAMTLHNSQPPLPQSRQPRSTRPIRSPRPTRSFRYSLPSQPSRPPRPIPPLFHETAPRLPLPPPPQAPSATTATTETSSTLPREYDDITGCEHGDTPETYYLPFPGDPDRTRVHLLRRAENIKRANREARPAWRD